MGVEIVQDPISIVGAGGHALVVIHAAQESGAPILGCYDDNPDAPAIAGPSKDVCLGNTDDFDATGPWILGIGSLSVRRALIDRFGTQRLVSPATSVIHPSAVVAKDAHIGVGVFIGPRAVVHPRAVIADHAIVNSGAIIEHECEVGTNTHIAPGSVLCGRVRVGDDTLIGAGTTIIPNVSIGSSCVIGAGSVVLRDIGSGSTAFGSPARALERSDRP